MSAKVVMFVVCVAGWIVGSALHQDGAWVLGMMALFIAPAIVFDDD